MASAPEFTGTPKVGVKLVSAANANRDGTGTLVDIFIGGASGSRIEHVTIIARGTTTVGVIRLFLNDGTTAFLIYEQLVTAITPSASVASFYANIPFNLDSILALIPNGYKLQAATHNAENFNVMAVGGDF